ncbi:McrC family protein [Stutzerimonas urumqiensis]|uniref:McrC family protein n=1 Tax=Stutzerimonas urumqiensis TaxID=638269 RepID=UPI000EB55762|nr:McrC family protein [Stutzerimonas urumqiensis]
MNDIITVREYARLTTDPVEAGSLDRARVPQSAFDYLCELSVSFSRGGASVLVQQDGSRALKLDSYVGVIETPCGTRLEILPKHTERDGCREESRTLLQRMIQAALRLPNRKVGAADLQLFDAPLSEWVMRQFLEALDYLVKRGLRFDYQRVEEEQRFLRGQLNVVGQMRQPPGRQHHFQIRHDILLPDRPENRLLKRALEKVCQSTQEPGNWRLGHELRSLLQEIPASRDLRQDFNKWRNDRLMAHYAPVRPWCELILGEQSPLSVTGDWRGISLLFPMERLFEQYVEVLLRAELPAGAQLLPQRRSKYLCTHDTDDFFQLRPDLLLKDGEQTWVLDTKWKLLNAGDRKNHYGLSQADFYQLFAYGHRYLPGEGELVLIYPSTERFRAPLEPFVFEQGKLTLWVVPFELEEGRLELTSSVAGKPELATLFSEACA